MGDKVQIQYDPESMRVMKSIARSLEKLTKTDGIVINQGGPIDVPPPTQKGTDVITFNSETVDRARRRILEVTTLGVGEVNHIFDELTKAGFLIVEAPSG